MVRIDSDNAEIGRKAAETLSSTGHFASFAFVPQADATIWSVRRGDAFAKALRRQKAHVVTLDVLRPLAPQLRALPKPSALFAASDLVGDRVLLECAREGIAVPDDLSVLGVDNEQLVCLHTRPPLASIQPDFERAGYLAAAALESMLEDRRTRSRQLYHLKGVVRRQSLQSARSAGRLVQRALELIGDSYSSFSNVDGLARSLGVSRRLLDLRFRQVLAKSVHEAIVEKRLESVCRMLATTDLSIAEICAASGIGTGTHPQRAFKLRLGMTMGAYRRQARSRKKAAATPCRRGD